MDKMMQCPKAEYCKDKCNGHNIPHKITGVCSAIWGFCPACIEVPEATEPRLYILPEKEVIKNPHLQLHSDGTYTETMASKFYAEGIDAVYAQAKQVDIDKLAEKLVGVHYTIAILRPTSSDYLKAFKQAIEEYIKE